MLFFLIAIIVCFILGIIFLLIGISKNKKRKELINRCSSSINGIYDKTNENHFPGETYQVTFIPYYKYIIDNKEYTYSGFGQSSEDKVNKNDITIHYNPENPNEAYSDEFNEEKTYKIFKLIGLGLLVLSIISFILWYVIK